VRGGQAKHSQNLSEFGTGHDRVAVIGAGVAGLSAAWLLGQSGAYVRVYERDRRLGGHANTVDVDTPSGPVAVDTGFIVFNDRNYPNFVRLLDALGVASQVSDMSFGVSLEGGNFEYAGSDRLSALLAQKRNILRPRFWRMAADILRFYKQCSALAPDNKGDWGIKDDGGKRNTDDQSPDLNPGLSLGDFARLHGYSQSFIDGHLLPMAAAVWSTPSHKVADFPFASYVRFCQHHGLLQIQDRPVWRTVTGGSRAYVGALVKQARADICAGRGVRSVVRQTDGVAVTDSAGQTDVFDRVIFATHGDVTARLLADQDPEEQRILGAFRYTDNLAVLHSNAAFMPKRKGAWSSWNYLGAADGAGTAMSVTYWMNRLQALEGCQNLFVTLNPQGEIAAADRLYEASYQHPVFDAATRNAQHDMAKIMGRGGVYYAGAHLGYGFHEDGVQSGLFAAELVCGAARPWMPSGIAAGTKAVTPTPAGTSTGTAAGQSLSEPAAFNDRLLFDTASVQARLRAQDAR